MAGSSFLEDGHIAKAAFQAEDMNIVEKVVHLGPYLVNSSQTHQFLEVHKGSCLVGMALGGHRGCLAYCLGNFAHYVFP